MSRAAQSRLAASVRLGACALAGVLAVPAQAFAFAPGDTPRPAAGATAHVVADTAQVLPRWTPSAGAVTSYGQDFARNDDGAVVLRRRTTTNLTFALGLFDHAEVLADLPMVLHQQGSRTDQSGDPTTAAGLQASALGDLRLGVKGTILRTPRRGFGLGIIADVTAPTGDASALAGTGGVQFSSRVLAEQTMARGIVVAANAGYLTRPRLQIGDVVVDDAVTLATAIRFPLDKRQILAWVGEINSYIGLSTGANHPVVFRTGLRARLRSGVVLGLYGGGAPVTTVGVPQVHGMFAVHWASPKRLRRERPFDGSAPPRATEIARRSARRQLAIAPPPAKFDPADPDGDGLLAALDRCPNVAEDHDDFEDDDGCPELDNDRDGLRDVMDQCPTEPELVNGALDWDGCPDFIEDGKVIALRHLDPARLVPKVTFAARSAQLDAQTVASLSAFAELMQLNPWLGAVSLRVYVQPSGDPTADRGLAEQRAVTVVGVLSARGVDPSRVRVDAPKAVRKDAEERARMAWADDPRASIPDGGPAPAAEPTLQRLLAEADERAAEAAGTGTERSLAQGPPIQAPLGQDAFRGTAQPPQPEHVAGAPVTPR